MRIICPSCSASYDVPGTLIRAGRIVRCAKCAREWSVRAEDASDAESPAAPFRASSSPVEPGPALRPADSPLAAAATPPDASSPAPKAVPLSPAGPPDEFGPGQPRVMETAGEDSEPFAPVTAIAWTASVVLMLSLGWAAYAWRADITHAWPPSARVYAALGLTVAPDGGASRESGCKL